MAKTQLQKWVDGILAKQVPLAPITVTRSLHPQVWKDLKRRMRNGDIAEAVNVRQSS